MMKTLINIAFAACFLFLLSTFSALANNSEKAKKIVAVADKYATSNTIRLSDYELHSITQHDTEFNGVIDKNRTDKYATNFFNKLKGIKYWSVCYRAKDSGVVGVVCVFMDKAFLKPLLIYRGK